MRKVRIVLNRKEYNLYFPETWAEIPTHLYPSIARLYLRKDEHMNMQDKYVRALAVLFDRNINLLWKMSEYDILELVPLVEWIFGDIQLAENKIPRVEVDGVSYLAPAGDFSNIRFGEFIMAETYFMQYVDGGMENRDTLRKLSAVLYRQKGKGDIYTPGHELYRGDERHKFNSNLVDDQAVAFRAIDIDVHDGIYLWYAVTRNIFFGFFPNVFSKRKSASGDSASSARAWGWMGVFDDMLGEKGRTADSLEDEFLSTVLLSLERTQIKVKELNRKK